MTESEFLNASDQVFERIENALDHSDLDLDLQRSGNVLEIDLGDHGKIIVNRHTFNQELWIAARSGGYHYRWVDNAWRNTRAEGEFFTELAQAISSQTQEAFAFDR